MKITENGAWLNETNEGHCFDEALADAIEDFMWENNLWTMLDLGCGEGKYVARINAFPGMMAIGYDGNPHTNYPMCQVADLSQPFYYNAQPMEGQYPDFILSLEVGEHIPAQFEDTFLDNVVKYAKDWIILSWAVPGQGGDGHVNCKPNGYITGAMEQRGFEIHLAETDKMRAASTLPWFKDTLMVFKRI